ncbi:hypothetical protein A2326_01555 [candidate division WWE3 bacterium RIFOXYB2_FULL_41_6]|nr:MAG: hypothetical protein A2326_01555 [candidate division WWE3 bacterium RIFOXYB2_FULL_41_6]
MSSTTKKVYKTVTVPVQNITPPEIPETTSTITQTTEPSYKLKVGYEINTVEDYKALGYTGQNKIALDSTGSIYTAYRKIYKDNEEIFVTKLEKLGPSRYAVSGDETPVSVVGNGATQRVPSLTISEDDIVHVVWYGLDPDNEQLGRQIKYSKSVDKGRSWSNWINIAIVSGYDDDDYWQEHPQVTTYKEFVYVVWEGKDSDNGQQQIKFSLSKNKGKDFSPWKNVQATPSNTQSRPSLVVDSGGRLHLFMYSSQSMEDGIQQIWHSISTDNGNSWSTWDNLSKSNLDARHASVGYNGSELMAVWRQQPDEGKPSQIFYSIYKNDKWSNPRVIRESDHYQMFPVVGSSKTGFAVSWMENRDSSDFPKDDPEASFGYVSYYKETTAGFSSPISISSTDNVLYPQLASSITEEYYLFYEKELGETYRIFFNRLTTK